MAWTQFNFFPEQFLSASMMNNFQGNFGGLANGDVGAPKIQLGALDSSITNCFVTNNATHDHVGGDGAPIPLGGFASHVISGPNAGLRPRNFKLSEGTLSGTFAPGGEFVTVALNPYALMPDILAFGIVEIEPSNILGTINQPRFGMFGDDTQYSVAYKYVAAS